MQGALSLSLSLYVSLTNELSHHAMRNQANELLNLSSFPKELFRKYLENNSVQNIDTSLEITSKSANIKKNNRNMLFK
jgi:hypothetical protein